MKGFRFFLFFSTVLFGGINLFAQSTDQTRKDADNALKAGNYASALTNYDKIITANPTLNDGQLYYNAAYCARKLEKTEKALNYFSKAEVAGYKSDISSYYKSECLYNLKKGKEIEKSLLQGIESYPQSNYHEAMKKLLARYYTDEGNLILNDAHSLVNSASNKTGEEAVNLKNQAKVKFGEAKELFNKAAQYDPYNPVIKQSIAEVNKYLK